MYLVLEQENFEWNYADCNRNSPMIVFATRNLQQIVCSLLIFTGGPVRSFSGPELGLSFQRKLPPWFSPGSPHKAPGSPPVPFVNEYQKTPVLPRFSSQMPPVLPRFFWAPPVLLRFSQHSTPTVKISTVRPDALVKTKRSPDEQGFFFFAELTWNLNWRKPKGTGERDGTKNVINCRDVCRKLS